MGKMWEVVNADETQKIEQVLTYATGEIESNSADLAAIKATLAEIKTKQATLQSEHATILEAIQNGGGGTPAEGMYCDPAFAEIGVNGENSLTVQVRNFTPNGQPIISIEGDKTPFLSATCSVGGTISLSLDPAFWYPLQKPYYGTLWIRDVMRNKVTYLAYVVKIG